MFKYYLDNQEHKPLNVGDLSIDITLKTEKGAYYHEYILNGSPKFDGLAYSFLMNYSDGQKVAFKIDEISETGTYEILRGYFTNRDCINCVDSKQIECKVRQDSLYQRLVDNYDKTFNMLETPNVVSSEYESTGNYDYKIDVNPSSNPKDAPLYGSYIQRFPSGSPFIGALAYGRELKTTYCQGGKPQKPVGNRWELYIDNCVGKGVCTWSRKPDVLISPLLLFTAFTTTNSVPPTIPLPPTTTVLNEDWVLMDTYTNPSLSLSFWIDFNVLRQDEISLNNGRLLVDVINYGLNKDVPELDVQSQFLTQEINPVNGETPSTTKDIQIHAIDDIKNPDVSNPATRQDIKLSQLLEGAVQGKYNCYWRVDERTKRLIIENNKDIFSQGVIDVTEHQTSRKYSYDNTDIPRSEEFPSEDSSIDFTGVPIEYDNEIAEGVKTFNVDSFYTEVESIIKDPETYPSSGYVLITKDSLKVDDPLAEKGAITEDYAPNMPQSTGVLHNKFFPYRRPFGSGLMNFINTGFEENKPVKVLEPVEMPICSLYFFDPYSRIIGKGFAKGSLISANYSFSTKRITLNINYNE
jgi:hypothetical protein